MLKNQDNSIKNWQNCNNFLDVENKIKQQTVKYKGNKIFLKS